MLGLYRMELIGTLGAVAGVITVLYLLYDRYVKKKHLVHITPGNVTIVYMASKDETKDGNLFVLIYAFDVVNSGSMPVTFRSLCLVWKSGLKTGECEPTNLAVGSAGSGNTIGLANSEDRIFIEGWQNVRELLARREVVDPGGVIHLSAAFQLPLSESEASELSDFTLILTDFSGNETRLQVGVQESWFNAMRKNISLIDAPVEGAEGQERFAGVELNTKRCTGENEDGTK